MTAPVSHLEQGLKLTADSLVDLWTIELRNDPIVYRFNNHQTLTWQNEEYECLPCKFSGESRQADGSESRPKLTVANPLGVFSAAVFGGLLDLAFVSRKRVLKAHIDANIALSDDRLWKVSRVLELISGQLVTLELRGLTEGPQQLIPARCYISPDFPTVTL